MSPEHEESQLKRVWRSATLPVATWVGFTGLLLLIGLFCIRGTWAQSEPEEESSPKFEIGVVTRGAPEIHGTVDGDLWMFAGEDSILEGEGKITGQWRVPGVPTVSLTGQLQFGGAEEGTGTSQPTNYTISLGEGAVLGKLITRTDPGEIAALETPPVLANTRDVVIDDPGDSVGDWATLRDLTLEPGAPDIIVPPGQYGQFVASTPGKGFILGEAGTSEPRVYILEKLNLNAGSLLKIVGPVELVVRGKVNLNNGSISGDKDHPSWLRVDVVADGLTVNNNATLYGLVRAPAGLVTVRGKFEGAMICDSLLVGQGGLFKFRPNQPPTIAIAAPQTGQRVAQDADVTFTLNFTDPDGAVNRVDLLADDGEEPYAVGSDEYPASPLNTSYGFSDLGDFTLRARALDDRGATTDSEPVVIRVRPANDLDMDGLPDDWEQAIVDGDAEDAIVTIDDVLSEDDFDGDGVSNGLERTRGTDPTSADESPILVARWKLDEASGAAAADAGPNGLQGTVLGESVGRLPGVEGDALDLGGRQTVRIPANPALNFGGPFSISAWVRPRSFDMEASQEIYRKEDGSNRVLLTFKQNGAVLAFGLNAGGYQELVVSVNPTDFLDGRWHLVTAVYDGSSRKLYRDGQLIGQQSTTGPLVATGNADAYLGSYGNTKEYFNGALDDVRIYNVALTPGELTHRVQQFDADGNGLSDGWEIENFGQSGVSATEDPDGDGLTTGEEYRLGRDPNQVDDAPLIRTGLRAWLNSATGVQTAANGEVTLWKDQSGHGQDYGSPAAVNRPKVNTDGQIGFDGIDDHLNPPALNEIKNNFTVVLVGNVSVSHEIDTEKTSGTDGTSGQRYLVYPNWGDGTWAGAGLSIGTNGLSAYENTGGYMPARAVFSGQVGASPRMLGLQYANRTPRLYLDGAMVREGTISPKGEVRMGWTIGGGNVYGYFKGSLAEVLVYDRPLSALEWKALAASSAAKYALIDPPVFDAVEAVSGTQASLVWNSSDATPLVLGYTIERRAGANGAFSPVAQLDASVSAWIDSGLVPGTIYSYRARVLGLGGESAYSPVVSVTTEPGASTFPVDSLTLWLKGGVGISTDEAAGVSRWVDASGHGLDATQTTSAGERPELIPDALNGNSTVRFDGTSDSLRLPAGFSDFTSGLTAYVVAKPTNRGGWQRFFQLGNGPWSDNIHLARFWTTDDLIYESYSGGNLASSLSAPGVMSLAEYHLYGVSHDTGANTLRLIKDGDQVAQGAAAALPNITRSANFIGKSNWNDALFQGDIAEVLLFNRSLSEAEADAVEDYLAQKYALSSVPAAPVISSLEAISATQASLVWTEGGSAIPPAHYSIERRTGVDGEFAEIATTEGLAFIDSDLIAGETYTYRVRGENALGLSAYSEEVSVALPAAGERLPFDSLVVWLRADAGTVSDGLGQVRRWIDASGTGYDASQSAVASRPQIVEGAVDGHPALRFDGSADYLSLPEGLDDFGDGLTAVVVARNTQPALWQRYFDFGNGPDSDNILLSRWFDSAHLAYGSFTGAANTASVTATNVILRDQYQMLSVTHDASIVRLYQNKWPVGQNSATPVSNVVRSKNFIGKSNWAQDALFQGDIAEVLVFNRALSIAELGAVQSYLNTKYDLFDDWEQDLPGTEPAVVASYNGAAGISVLGSWVTADDGLVSGTPKAEAAFQIDLPSAGMFRLAIDVSSESNPSWDYQHWLAISVDGQPVGRISLLLPPGESATGHILLPWLNAGPHEVRVLYDNTRSYRAVRILALRIEDFGGDDADQDGVPDWVEGRLESLNGLHAPTDSYVSPLCVEGTARFRPLIDLTVDGEDVEVQPAPGDGWYADVALNADTPVSVQASFENSALEETASVTWKPLNVLTDGPQLDNNRIRIRAGDSLLLAGHPDGQTSGTTSIEVSADGVDPVQYSQTATATQPHQFEQPGLYTVSASHDDGAGAIAVGSIEVEVIAGQFNGDPILGLDSAIDWDNPDIPANSLILVDHGVSLTDITPEGAPGARFRLQTSNLGESYSLLRLGENGPVLDHAAIKGIRVASNEQTAVDLLEEYADGSKLIGVPIMLSEWTDQTRVEVEIFVNGVTFEDGTIRKVFTAADLDELGRVYVKFVWGAGLWTSVCHRIHVYEGDTYLGTF